MLFRLYSYQTSMKSQDIFCVNIIKFYEEVIFQCIYTCGNVLHANNMSDTHVSFLVQYSYTCNTNSNSKLKYFIIVSPLLH